MWQKKTGGCFNPFKLNGISHCYQLDQSFSNFRGVGWYFSYFPNFSCIFCKQTVKILTRHNIVRCLIWICNICPCPIKRKLGLYGLMSHQKNFREWLSGRVLDLRPKGCRFEPHRHHWVVILEQDTFILA